MEDGGLNDEVNPWGLALFQTLEGVEPDSNCGTVRLRQVARSDIHPRGGAAGPHARSGGHHPTPLWIVLFLGTALIFVFMLFFADSGERAVVQAMMIGSVTAIMVAILLLINVLDNPFHTGVGGLRPVAMERTLDSWRLSSRHVGAAGPAPVRGPRAAPR